MAIREGKWKCEYCEAVNLGRDMKCGSCGAVRGEHVKFFLEDDAGEVTDDGLASLAKGGADWHCDFCGTDNRAAAAVCRQCGASKEGMKSREETMTPQNDPPEAKPVSSAVNPVGKKRAPVIPVAIGVIAVIIAAAAGFFLLKGKEAALVLDKGEWVREIAVEHREWVEYTDWEDDVPADAVIYDSWEEQRGTEKVQTGTERVVVGTKDKGNGFFEDIYEDKPVYEDRPVYDRKVRYELYEWTQYREVTAEGTADDRPVWPDPGLTSGDREGNRTESAVLYFHSTDPDLEGKIFTYDGFSPEEIMAHSIGDTYNAVIYGSKIRKFITD